MRLSRRNVLLGAAAAGGLVVAWSLTPRRFAAPLSADHDETVFDAWIRIGRSGAVSVTIPQLEMGQGVSTMLAQIIAVELGADWRRVGIEPAPVSGVFGNAPLAERWANLWMSALPGLASAGHGLLARRFAETEDFVATADGLSLAAYEAPARAAAASARAMLAKAAAARWGVGWEECAVENSQVLHGDKRLSFAALADEAAGHAAPNPPVLRPAPAAERAIELPPGAAPRFPRLDLPAKVDGSMLFAGDVRLPEMVFAAIRHAPMGDARLGSYDTGKARGIAGFGRLVRGDTWLAATGETWWAAERALKAIAPRFRIGERAQSEVIARRLDAGLRRGKANRLAVAGDPDSYLAGDFSLVAHYRTEPALHSAIETASATARFADGRLELWAASQAPGQLRNCAARVLGLPARKVVVYPLPAGGSFDRRLEHEHAIEAALIAREVGKPVQLVWSRWQEHVAGLPRAPLHAVLAARTAPDGSLAALKIRAAMPATTREFGERLFGMKDAWAARGAQDEDDPLALEGLVPPYAVPHLVVEHVPTPIPLATGQMRGNGPALTAFLIESFIDELARQAQAEPLSYRMAMLGREAGLAACLQRAATLAEWNGGTQGSGQGLACLRMSRGEATGRIAAIVSARRDTRGIRVDKITAVVDIGRVINIDIARQQLEGGLIFGLGLATGSATAYADGLPTAQRLAMLGLPALGDCPEIELDFIDSHDPPFDPGELGVAVIAPAIANALYSATGARLRTLPLTAGGG